MGVKTSCPYGSDSWQIEPSPHVSVTWRLFETNRLGHVMSGHKGVFGQAKPLCLLSTLAEPFVYGLAVFKAEI